MLLIAILQLPSLIWAQKTDQLLIRNGDVITGEVKEMSLGMLQYKTDDMATINVKWEAVRAVYSRNYFEIEKIDGTILFGALDSAGVGLDTLRVAITSTLNVDIPMLEVSRLNRIRKTFWERLDGYLDFGGSYTKAGNVLQFNLAMDIRYRSDMNFYRFKANTIQTFRENEQPAVKQDATFSYDHNFSKNWGVTAFTTAESNSEQGLDLRLLAGSGGLKDFVNKLGEKGSGTAGLLVTQEFGTDQTESTSLEAYIGLDYKKYRYYSPKVDLSLSIRFYPSLTKSDRYRSTFDGSLRIELFKDFYFNLSGYIRYDTQPVDETAANSDWGTVLGISYEL
jgi:hypothetical protein